MNGKLTNRHGNASKVIDFPSDESVSAQAARWLAALDADQPSEETLAAFKVWINADETHRAEFESTAAFWGELNILTEVTPPRTHPVAAQKRIVGWRPVFAGFAAVCLAVFALVFLQLHNAPTTQIYITAVGEQKTIELPDHSTVFLNTDSRIVVDFTSVHRGIRLERGEALFEVAHDKTKPFEVRAGDRIVRAVGTAFSVHLQPDNVEVLVSEGVVEIDKPLASSVHTSSVSTIQANSANSSNVAALEKPEKVRVAAGSQALFSNEEDRQVLVVEIKRIEDKLTWRTGVLTFDREPLERVVNEVSRYTATKFIVPEQDVREMIVGGVFKVGDTESLFEALQLGFGIQAREVANNVVYLSRIDTKSN